MTKEKLKRFIEEAPEKPGVYIFQKQNIPLYIGKAYNLKERLKQYLNYFSNPRISRFIKLSNKIDFIVLNSEKEALLLEAEFIKRYQPKYNIRLKDDKKYPYIKVTLNDKYPGIYLTRNLNDKNSVYFGPYVDVKSAKKMIQTVRNIFPIRNCYYSLKKPISPCTYYYIGKCLAPCTHKISEKEYKKYVEKVIDFLKGKTEEVERQLEEEMLKASESMNFEKAVVIRDQLLSIRKLKGKTKIFEIKGKDKDIIGIKSVEKIGVGVILQVREEKIVNKISFVFEIPNENDDFLYAFLTQYYTSSTITAEEIIVPYSPPDKKEIEEILKEKMNKDIKIREPLPEEKNLVKLAEENAEYTLNEELNVLKIKITIPKTLEELQKILGLKNPPIRIEGIDISQLFQEWRVGSVVVFVNGKPKKSEYRKFKIKTEVKDDFSMIYEVVYRRFKRLKEENKILPDLVVIDGGIVQLKYALKALKDLEISQEKVKVIAIEKRPDEIVFPDGKKIMIPSNSFALRLIQRIRDEAHRFAKLYHVSLREKDIKTFLEKLPDIGEKRAKNLLLYFGSLERLKKASLGELTLVPGIGKKLALKIYKILRKY